MYDVKVFAQELIDNSFQTVLRHLPYSRAAQDFMLEQPKKSKKRVSIIPTGQSQLEPPRQVPQINVPSFVSSPDKDNLIELTKLGNSLEDMNSISSEDSFNENLLLAEKDKDAASAERLARLKSTLTFDEPDPLEVSRAVTRIDEEDSEALEEDSAPTSPMLAVESHELVLSPAKLQNGE